MASLAELLSELKERSGLSYGVLAKRLHMSTSTLHRYCNGDAVPTEFAPVQRLARLCRATPEEMVEVHRRWILADADRGRKPGRAASGASTATAARAPGNHGAGPTSSATANPAPLPEHGAEATPTAEPGTPSGPGRVTAALPLSLSRRRRTFALAAAVAAVVGIGSAALVLHGGAGDGQRRDTGRTAVSSDASVLRSPGAGHGKGDGKDDAGKKKGAASAPPTQEKSPSSGASRNSGTGTAPGGVRGEPDLVTTRTKPYVYEDPCAKDFLVNRAPGDMPQPPAADQDAPGWVGDLGAVSSRDQFVEVTVQGVGRQPVVLERMNVRVQSTGAPLAWNNYQMHTGCGGDVSTKSFAVDLDDSAPRAAPEHGQRDFPYKISETDPEVFYISANAEAHDVRWYLELEWSSGERHGVTRIDDQSKPFRTSGSAGRPTYGWPPGATHWERQLQDG
ncbi:helix-turn-helix domain-containing protein [Streptomyces sp. NPDC005863]|uniref:helix-turn-helix domain-containing protein n=1 Tax=unclassified Streptomyces TaxID=2593676 RepID=UPI0033E3EF35